MASKISINPHLVIKLFVCAVVSFSLVLLASSNSYAVIQQQVEFVDSYTGQTIQSFVYAANTGPMNCNYNCTVSTNANTDIMSVINGIIFNVPAQNYYTDGIVEYSFTIHKVNNSQSLHDFIAGWHVSDNNFKLMSVDIENQDTNAFSVHLYLKVISNGYASNFYLTSQNSSTYLLALQPGGRIAVSGVSLWRVVSPETNQNIIDAINSQPNYTSALNSVDSHIQEVQDSIEQSNQDAEDRYEDEKDTIDQNGQDAQDSADDLDISFGVPWIFQGWFSLFIDNDCVSIPTLKQWLHSTQNQVCTPWPTAIRSALTPIFGILSGMFIFGFVIRWLRSGAFNGSIELS